MSFSSRRPCARCCCDRTPGRVAPRAAGGAGAPPRRAARRGLCGAHAQIRGRPPRAMAPLRAGDMQCGMPLSAAPRTLSTGDVNGQLDQPDQDARGGAQTLARARRRIDAMARAPPPGPEHDVAVVDLAGVAMPDWPSQNVVPCTVTDVSGHELVAGRRSPRGLARSESLHARRSRRATAVRTWGSPPTAS